MKRVAVCFFIADMVIAGLLPVAQALDARPNRRAAATPAAGPVAPITIDYPAEGSIFPPDLAPPTFLWRDGNTAATLWRIDVTFADRSTAVQVRSLGEPMPVGEIDQLCAKAGAVDPRPTFQQAATHSWKPGAETWEEIKKHSVKHAAIVTVSGFRDQNTAEAVSRGQVTIQTSKDPVGAPIFYRDVPLISVPVGEKGVIMPLPSDAVPLIAWRLRNVGEPRSKLMMQGLPTCANCHSFSRDGKTLGLDVDGPSNDKGLYGLVPVRKETSIRNEDIIRWQSFSDEPASKRFGFMSQVSPDGQYVVTSIEVPGMRERILEKRLYNGFYKDYGFGQVFFPTRGILAWYSKATGRLQSLPGADDPRYVQAGAFWSPDGKYVVYSRAEAKDPYREGQMPAQYANDPNETQIQYDLYRIPFNGGKGGAPEPIAGAGHNGMSNNFPKVSPDGKWIVFVQCRNGLLMRPDSQLYIVPTKGGTARRLQANLPLMNSWHSFSPNGRWLVFSSKGRSLYTQMFLTHIDKNGLDSPAILIENATAANRAVNIPEFVNIPRAGLTKIDAPATEFYRLYDIAADLARNGKYAEAVPAWKKAIELDPEDARARHYLAVSLQNQGLLEEALSQYQKSLELKPENAAANTNIGVILAGNGNLDAAIDHFLKALAIKPRNPDAEYNLGNALIEKGRKEEAIEHFRKALEADPEYPDAHNSLGIALAKAGQLDEGISHLEKAVAINSGSLEYQYNLGRVLAARSRFGQAIPHLEKAVEVSGGHDPLSLDMLAAMYAEVGRFAEAAQTARRALDLAVRDNNYALAQALRARIAQYEVQK